MVRKSLKTIISTASETSIFHRRHSSMDDRGHTASSTNTRNTQSALQVPRSIMSKQSSGKMHNTNVRFRTKTPSLNNANAVG